MYYRKFTFRPARNLPKEFRAQDIMNAIGFVWLIPPSDRNITSGTVMGIFPILI